MQLPSASSAAQLDVVRDLRRMCDRFFPVDPAQDAPFEAGRLCFRHGLFQAAVDFFRRSLLTMGEHHVTRHNLGLCMYQLLRLDEAAAEFAAALAAQPGFGKAESWLQRTQRAVQLRDEGVDVAVAAMQALGETVEE